MSIDAIVSTLEQELLSLDGVSSVLLHPKRNERVTLPALLIDLAEFEPGQDRGTGETPIRCHMELRVVTSDRGSPLTLWNIAQQVMQWLFDFNWPQENIGRAEFKNASPDHFSPEFQGHRVFLIEWVQEMRVGENIWLGEPPQIEEYRINYPLSIPEPPTETVDVRNENNGDTRDTPP